MKAENIKVSIKDVPEVIKQIETINKELDQYKNNWEELKRILEKQLIDCNKCSGQSYYFKYILDEMKELEENK
jgi:hypothetical protein